MELYVVRHGQVPSNVEGVVSGWSDEKLTERGIEQANKIKGELQNIKFDKIYSSPIERAKETAEIIMPESEIIYDKRLAEREPGTMLGQPRKSIDKDIWNSLDTDRTPEGAETLRAGLKRAKSILGEIKEKDKNKTVLIVTHMFISKCIWVLEENVQDKEQINQFFHANDEIKHYIEKDKGIEDEEDFDR